MSERGGTRGPAFRAALLRPWWLARRLLARPHAARVLIALSLLLGCASLDTGLGADDHIHALILRGSEEFAGWSRHPLDLFRFADGDPTHVRQLMNDGVFPWWADLEAKLAFFRPLTALTHWADHRLWPDSPWLMHLQSLLWLAGLLVLVHRLYARLIEPRWLATLALLLFALDDARAPPVAWVANRNAIVAAVGAVAALWLHDRWRRDGDRLAALFAPVALGLGLLGAEGAIAIVGYLLAYALFLDDDRPAKRVASLAPYALVVVLWRAVYVGLGYGVSASGVYLDPLHSPLAYLTSLGVRLPVLWLSQWALPWSDFWTLYPYMAPGAEIVVFVFAVALLAVTVVLVAPLWRRDARARFWATGALLALFPAAATFPSDRLLTLVGLGAMPLLALVVRQAMRDLRAGAPRWARWRARSVLPAVVIVHVVLAVVLFPMRARVIVTVREALERADEGVPSGPGVAERTVVYANPPSDPFASYIPIMRAESGTPRPGAQRRLATGLSPVHLTRLDAHTLRVRPEEGFVSTPMERMLRSPEHPLKRGEAIALDGMHVRVTALADDGRPAEAVIRFERALEHPSFLWLRWTDGGYVPFVPPPPGETVTLEAVDLARATFGE